METENEHFHQQIHRGGSRCGGRASGAVRDRYPLVHSGDPADRGDGSRAAARLAGAEQSALGMSGWAALVAVLKGLLELVKFWERRKAINDAVEGVQDDTRIADQAAAIRVHRDADSVRAEPAVDPVTSFKRERLGRRKSTSNKPLS